MHTLIDVMVNTELLLLRNKTSHHHTENLLKTTAYMLTLRE